MDYCKVCRRHLNGALSCPGCGATGIELSSVQDARSTMRMPRVGDRVNGAEPPPELVPTSLIEPEATASEDAEHTEDAEPARDGERDRGRGRDRKRAERERAEREQAERERDQERASETADAPADAPVSHAKRTPAAGPHGVGGGASQAASAVGHASDGDGGGYTVGDGTTDSGYTAGRSTSSGNAADVGSGSGYGAGESSADSGYTADGSVVGSGSGSGSGSGGHGAGGDDSGPDTVTFPEAESDSSYNSGSEHRSARRGQRRRGVRLMVTGGCAGIAVVGFLIFGGGGAHGPAPVAATRTSAAPPHTSAAPTPSSVNLGTASLSPSPSASSAAPTSASPSPSPTRTTVSKAPTTSQPPPSSAAPTSAKPSASASHTAKPSSSPPCFLFIC